MSTHVMFGDCRGKFHLDVLKENGWGRMFATQKPTPFEGEKWGFDNGAFKCWTEGLPFDEFQFEKRMKDALVSGTPYLAVVPDIVAAGCSSLEFSIRWVHQLRQREIHWPWYLAVQDGMSIHDVKPHMDLFSGIFLGGSDTFKAQGWKWCCFAHDHGKPFHYGRAGTISKLESAMKMKADSLDSNFPLWEKARTRQFVRQYHYWKENPRPELEFGG